MGKKLSSNVHLTDSDGNAVVFGPGDEVPAWAEKLITNKSAWAEDEKSEPKPASPPSTPEAQRK